MDNAYTCLNSKGAIVMNLKIEIEGSAFVLGFLV